MITCFTEPRKNRLIHERNHDPYRPSGKPAEPAVCPECHAVFKDGRWQWLDSWPVDSHPEICQACQRIRDNYPAGFVTISGDFMKSHKQEIINLARNQEAGERVRHPLHRIIRIEERPDELVIATTDIHLPKRIGQALQDAYKGVLDLHYDQEGCLVRVKWVSHDDKLIRSVRRRK